MKTCLSCSLLTFLIVGFSIGSENQETSARFAKPAKLWANGAVLDVGEDIGYAGPLVTDYDKDGKQDLIVTSIRGSFRWYRNVSEGNVPMYEHKGLLQTHEGKPLKLNNW